MHSVILQIGSFTVYGYGLMIALGIIACFVMGMYRAKRYGIDPDFMFNFGVIGLIAGLIGAKVLYWIVEIDAIIKNPSILLDFGDGFVVYGGLIVGILAPVIYTKIKKTSFLDKIELCMPSIALAQGFGRIGCLLAGCCYGAEVHGGFPFSLTFPAGSLAPAGVPLYPTQIMSSVFDFALAGLLIFLTPRVKRGGHLTCIYLFCYGVGRFLIEFLRNDPRGSVGVLSTSQFISIFFVVIAVVLWIIFNKKKIEPLRRAVSSGKAKVNDK